jgi:hypothetical protein
VKKKKPTFFSFAGISGYISDANEKLLGHVKDTGLVTPMTAAKIIRSMLEDQEKKK